MSEQAAAIAFLSRPETYGVDRVERVDTHISAVFLAGDHAYKLKRAVKLPYLDFSTLSLRKKFCEAEVATNKRTAPQIYERVAALTREADGSIAFDGTGAALDYVVVMRRFDEAGTFDRLAGRGALTPELMSALADAIAKFHAAAERRTDFGGASAMGVLLDLNETNFERHGAILDRKQAMRLCALSWGELTGLAKLLDKRRAQGFVRHCHGDLHLRNICLYDGAPLLFDAIEFSESIACIDVLYDLAFLLMDLEHRELRTLGNIVFNRYLDDSTQDAGELSGLAALPLFLSIRAGVRAHVGAEAAARQAEAKARARGEDEARSYLDLAARLMQGAPPRLVAVGGLSGTGKSTLARALAPEIGAAPGALILRSDILRKRLWGCGEFERLPEEAYGADMTARVYATIEAYAGTALEARHAVIADAVYGRPEQRQALEEVAEKAGAAFTGLWLEAPRSELERRIETRERDASDATVAVLRAQLARPVGPLTWRRLDTGGGSQATLASARKLLA